MLSEALRTITHMHCVPVIASFSSNGEMIPLYTVINSVRFKIESSRQEEQRNGQNWITFRCRIIDNDIRKEMELFYCVNEHAWFAPSEYFKE
mgnify:FL=1